MAYNADAHLTVAQGKTITERILSEMEKKLSTSTETATDDEVSEMLDEIFGASEDGGEEEP